MGIHVLATNLAQQNTGFEPQRQHNWAIEIPFAGLSAGSGALIGLLSRAIGIDLGHSGMDNIVLSLASGFLPRGANEEVPIPYGNETVYVAGKATWDAGALVIRDWVDVDVMGALVAWRSAVYNPATGQIGLARNYKLDCDVLLFGPNSVDSVFSDYGATYLRKWTLVGCWPVSINPAANGLDMANSNQVMIEMALRYDKAFPTHRGIRESLEAVGVNMVTQAILG
jgi:hypothetical protein